jgi:hypothetical protein
MKIVAALATLLVVASFAAPARADELTLDPELFPEASLPRPSAAGGPVSVGAYGGRAVSPQGRTFGIGLQLGSPTALTIKYMLTGDQGIVAGIGGSPGYYFDGHFALSIHADYLWHPHVLAAAPPFRLSWYLGGGLQALVFGVYGRRNYAGYSYFNGYDGFGLIGRVPLGLDLAFTQIPFEIYVELVPAVVIFPYIGFGIGGAIGGRFYF